MLQLQYQFYHLLNYSRRKRIGIMPYLYTNFVFFITQTKPPSTSPTVLSGVNGTKGIGRYELQINILLPPSHSLPLASSSPTSLFSKSMILFSVEMFICAGYQIPVISDIIWYLSLSFQLISLSMSLQFHPCCCKWHYVILFYG